MYHLWFLGKSRLFFTQIKIIIPLFIKKSSCDRRKLREVLMSKHHCHEGSCSCPCHHHHESCPCCEGGTCSVCHGNHEGSEKGDFAGELLTLADQAWMEVLKEKIKKQIESESGSHLDNLAKLVAQTNQMRWKNKLEAKHGCHEFKDKLADLFKKK
jgi:hypothetical protein